MPEAPQSSPAPRVLLLLGQASGGIAAHVGALADGLPAAGVDVVVATSARTAAHLGAPRSGPQARGRQARGRQAAAAQLPSGARVLALWPDPPARRRRVGSGWTPARLRRLRAAVAGADVVHAHGHQAGSWAVAVSRTLPRRRRPAVVVTWHNAVLGHGPVRALRALAERVQARGADLLTGASGDLVARGGALGAAGPQLTPVAALAPQPRSTGPLATPEGLDDLAAGVPVVLTVSRVARQKDLPTLVRAAARLRDRPLVWLVVGDGDVVLTERLLAQVRANGAPVRLLGARRDVPALLARADVFALSSTWEARSLAVQEAMAAGLPVVATRTGGLTDLLEGVGALVPVGDDAALAAAVAALLDDPARAGAAGRAAREASAVLPTSAQVLRGWADRYAGLAGRHRLDGRRAGR